MPNKFAQDLKAGDHIGVKTNNFKATKDAFERGGKVVITNDKYGETTANMNQRIPLYEPEVMSQAIQMGKKVSAVFIFIRSFIEENGWAPTTTEIAKYLHKKPSDITKYLNLLVEHKFIVWEGSRKIRILNK